MPGLKHGILAAAIALAIWGGVVRANPIVVTGYSVFGVNEHVSYTGRINNEYAGVGQITLLTAQGSLSSWCTDLFDNLAPGTFTQQTLTTDQDNIGAVLTPTQIAQIGGLVNAGDAMASAPQGFTAQASAAIQNAIWTVEYGTAFSFKSDDQTVAGLTKTYVADVASGVFALSGSVTQFVAGGNQGQATSAARAATATAVPEPASLALLAAAIFGMVWLRHRRKA